MLMKGRIEQMRNRHFLYNTIASLFCQLIGIICGMLLPRLMISGFGSELYGTTVSIAEFLGYISLLEGESVVWHERHYISRFLNTIRIP